MSNYQLVRLVDVEDLLVAFDAGLPITVAELDAASILDVLALCARAERTLGPLIVYLSQRARTAKEEQAWINALDARDAVQLARQLLARLHPDYEDLADDQ